MKTLQTIFTRGIGSILAACAIIAMAPTSGYGGLLGTTANGTLNVGVSTRNYFDLSAVPGSAPVSALVVNPGVEFPGNQPALQADFPGVTMHVSADIGDHEILLTWINSGLVSATIPTHKFTFGLFPAGGQNISNAVFDLGLPPSSVTHGAKSVTIIQGPITLGGGTSTFAHYTLSFVSVPEPGTYMLLGSMSLIALFAVRRREGTVKVS